MSSKQTIEQRMKLLLLVAFALSGFSSLVYEVVWVRPLQLIFGSTIYAFSTILTSFFIGFAIGAFFIRNYADRTDKPVTVFALIQLGIGLYGLIILWLFGILPSIYLFLDIAGLQFIQFLLLSLVIIIPAILFGALWPIVNKIFVGTTAKEKQGKEIGLLYSANSLGSALGPLAAGFVMVPFFGIKVSAMITACLNIFIGFVLFWYVKITMKGGKRK